MTNQVPPAIPPVGSGFADWEAAMAVALAEARAAAERDEAPIGALCLSPEGAMLARAHNQPIADTDPTAHAEIRCLRAAARVMGNYRLPGSILVCTLEPCLMCVGALIQARVAGVVYGAADPKAGALVSHLQGNALPFSNHRFWVLGGVLSEECGGLLRDFFRARR
jgi:tRNA(adenine34) deaminase